MKTLMLLLARFLSTLLLVGAVSGCAGGAMEFGSEPRVERLHDLRLGLSTKEDVRQVLGQPTGAGAARMPDFPGYRNIWSYEISKIDGTTSEITILLVFFQGDAYDGYIWFDNAREFEELS